MHQDASGTGTPVALKVLALKPLIILVKWMKRATWRGGNRDKADWKEKGRKEWKEATKAESLPQKLWPSLHCQHLFNVTLKYFICPAYTENDNVSLPTVPSLIYMEKVCKVHWCTSCVSTPAWNSCFTPLPLLLRNMYSKQKSKLWSHGFKKLQISAVQLSEVLQCTPYTTCVLGKKCENALSFNVNTTKKPSAGQCQLSSYITCEWARFC